MRAALHRRFGAANDVLEIVSDFAPPTPGPDDLLVHVRATSVNPIDCAMRQGYGAAYFKKLGILHDPHIPGRDVAGEVIAIGANVTTFKPGDQIWAAVLWGGSAEFAAVPAKAAALMPQSLDHGEAASFPFAGLTAWTALVVHGGLTSENTRGKKVVIPRGAGGVGAYAIQLLKAWGAEVATIVSTGNVERVRKLGADTIIDHTKQDFANVLRDYDVAFDTSFDTEDRLLNTLKKHGDALYVSVVTPKLTLIDELGLDAGIAEGERVFAEKKAQQGALGRRYAWSFAIPDGNALRQVGALFDAGRMRPVIDSRYPLERLDEAQAHSESGKVAGKIVIDVAPLKARKRSNPSVGARPAPKAARLPPSASR
jgi:NADPH:quinone reductase-like Zn-dependent oxidoreductase